MTAWFAFGLSVVALAWNFILTYVRWPRIGVVMRQSVYIQPLPARAVARANPPTIISSSSTDTAPVQAEAEPPAEEPAEQDPAPTGSAGDKFHLIVVNRGAEATSIANVGIRSEDSTIKVDVEHRRDNGADIAGPELPARVEAHGALHWIIGSELTRDFPRGTKLIGYAFRYRTFRKYPKSRRTPYKIYETAIVHTKN